jgi:F-type H+-transporting ATPase subunit b
MVLRMRFGLNLAAAAALALLLLASTAPALAQHEPAAPAPAVAGHAAPAQGEHVAQPGGQAAAGEHAAEGEHGNPIVGLIARLFNFAIMAGVLVYFLKSPIADHLRDRGKQIRSDLVKAADMRGAAAAQMAAIELKMAALPGELDALRKTGAQEVAAEEARIRQAAEGERARLLEQARREIDSQLKLAERDLIARTADLAVAVAAARVKATITAEDQARLVDQYLGRLAATPTPEGGGTV